MLRVVGGVLTTFSAMLFLAVFFADLFGLHTNPYLGVVFFLVLPALFLLGLVLIPIGGWRGKWPRVDLNDPSQRATAFVILVLTIANVVIVSMAAYRGVEYVDSVSFCGQVCHTVMQPEFVAHQTGPHAGVRCIDCHAGPGAMSFVSAKAAGVRRVLATVRSTYARPIVPEPQQLPTAAETCEQCHSPALTRGDRTRRVVEYADNEKNTESVTTLKVHVDVIHRHLEKNIEYVATDKTRQTIPYVRIADRDGTVREFVVAGTTPEQIRNGERRRMDCIDCHNRPSHGVAPTPERAVNEAIAAGTIPATLPFVHRESVKALKAGNPAGVGQSFRSQPADQVAHAAAALELIYQRNVFPAMNVTFGTYPNNIGHVDSPGCFRCHDDDHKSTDGKKIGQDCESCHAIE
ncbi:MAG TPA: NapC/NirT family cytochrome c [Vicinamibacterales bacterium]|nr:NapC/NirT family cytochrome c [Vicinamibacterales bacterium]